MTSGSILLTFAPMVRNGRRTHPTARRVGVSDRDPRQDESALASALREGRIADATLDVFAHEPPFDSPLLALPTVLATPHIGGTLEAGRRMALLAAQNALQVLSGSRCPHTINPEVYEAPPRSS